MNNEFDSRQHKLDLMLALGFDADDLDANLHGYMSKKQRKTLSHFRRTWKFLIGLVVVITPIGIFITIIDGYRIHDSPSSRFGICVLIIVLGSAFLVYAYTKVQKFNTDLLKGDVLEVGGPIRRYYFAGRGQETIHIADHIFRTNEHGRFYGFRLGESYRIFYAPFSKYVLSAKLLYEQESIPEIPKILKANPPMT